MRLITGDECGLLKECIPELSSNPKNKIRDFDDDEIMVSPRNSMAHVALDGVRRIDSKELQNRQRALVDMTFTSEEELSFVALRQNGSLQLWEGSAESKKAFGKYRKSYETENIFEKVTDEAMAHAWKPLGLGAFTKESRLCAGDSFGNISIANMKNGSVVHSYNAFMTSKGGKSISSIPGKKLNTQLATSMACHPLHYWVAMGGREREATILDLSSGKVIFKAKNLPPDPQTLLQHPVWPTAIMFLQDGNTMAVGTAYKELRLYDVRESSTTRRPIARSTTEGGPIEYRVTSLCQVSDQEVAVGDAAGYIYSIDMRTLGKSNVARIKSNNMGRYVGPVGSVRQLKKHPTLPRMAAVGLDRMLRVYDTENRKQLDGFYLKQRLNCVLFARDGDWRPGSSLDDEGEDDGDQDIDQDDVVQDYVDSDEEQDGSGSSGNSESEPSDEEGSSTSGEEPEEVDRVQEQATDEESSSEEDEDEDEDDELPGIGIDRSSEISDDDADEDEEIVIVAPKKKHRRR
jgi:ribosome biogenesis protein NSA1